jgi:hypothetical protein
MDRFGQEIFTVKGKILNLPRSSTCKKIYKNTKMLVMTKSAPYAYNVVPHINEKCYSDKESLTRVKEIIWYNFFDHPGEYIFDESRHYPKPFKIYLEYRLNLRLELEETDMFIVLVRNSVFARMVYTCGPRLVAGANWIADGVLRMSDSHSYIIRTRWPEWSKIITQEN